MTLDEIKRKYKQFNIAEKLILINVLVFLLFNLISFLFKDQFLFDWFVLSKNTDVFITKPWSIITYAFIHIDLIHVLMNMIMLYYVSRLFLNSYSPRTLLNLYFLGGIVGGVLFLLSYNLFPAFAGESAFLIGASASVMAILLFVCSYSPNKEVRFFTFAIKLWHIAALFMLLDLIQIPRGNAGGHIAHLGGALLGYVYASQLKKGKDIGSGFEKLMNTVVSWFKPKPAKMKTVHRSQKKANDRTIYQKERLKQEQIDAILDKISKSGYESLSKAEKDFLFQAGKE